MKKEMLIEKIIIKSSFFERESLPIRFGVILFLPLGGMMDNI